MQEVICFGTFLYHYIDSFMFLEGGYSPHSPHSPLNLPLSMYVGSVGRRDALSAKALPVFSHSIGICVLIIINATSHFEELPIPLQ